MDEKKKDGDTPALEAAGSWWGGLTGEFKRISWPSRPELVKMTIAAIVMSGIVGAIIIGYDFILQFLYDGLVSLVR